MPPLRNSVRLMQLMYSAGILIFQVSSHTKGYLEIIAKYPDFTGTVKPHLAATSLIRPIVATFSKSQHSSEVLPNLINKTTSLVGPKFLDPEVALLMRFHCIKWKEGMG